MNANSATVQGESYVYGGILFQRVTDVEGSQRTDIGTCLMQGFLTGAALMFLVGLYFTLTAPAEGGYQFFVALYIPVAICFGLVSGFVEGLVMGICIQVAGHDLRWFTRAIIGTLVFAIPCVALTIAFNSSTELRTGLTEHLAVLLIFSAPGPILGIFTGSNIFATCRALAYRMFAYLKEEARYYLID